jgi:hypothetical protein
MVRISDLQKMLPKARGALIIRVTDNGEAKGLSLHPRPSTSPSSVPVDKNIPNFFKFWSWQDSRLELLHCRLCSPIGHFFWLSARIVYCRKNIKTVATFWIRILHICNFSTKTRVLRTIQESSVSSQVFGSAFSLPFCEFVSRGLFSLALEVLRDQASMTEKGRIGCLA